MDLCFAPDEAIALRPMTQVAEAQGDAEDWTGVTSAKERRKLQNRLNQRARRRKQKQQAKTQTTSNVHAPNCPGANPTTLVFDNLDTLVVALGRMVLVSREDNAVAVQRRAPSKPYVVTVSGSPGVLETCERLSQTAQEAYLRYSVGDPDRRHLTTVVHFNVFSALARNAALLGLTNEWLIKGTISSFNKPGPVPGSGLAPTYPDNFHPTDLQRSVPHHPWIDLLPTPRMRDNFLRAAQEKVGTVDEDCLCRDIVDVESGGDGALVVWGNPWEPGSWEATERFLRRWGWLLEGCTEVLEGTNRWRRERGLRPFRYKVET